MSGQKALIPLVAAMVVLVVSSPSIAQTLYFTPGARDDAAARYYSYSNRYDRMQRGGYVRFAPPRYAAPPRVIDRAPVIRDTDAYAIQGRRNVQKRLNELGYGAGAVDGVYGQQTRNAMAAFQASIGARPTGRLTGGQIEALYSRDAPVRRAAVRQADPETGASAPTPRVARKPVPAPEPEHTATAAISPAKPAATPPAPSVKTSDKDGKAPAQPAQAPVAKTGATDSERTAAPASTVKISPEIGKSKPTVAAEPDAKTVATTDAKTPIPEKRADSDRAYRQIVAPRKDDKPKAVLMAQAPSTPTQPTIDDGTVTTLPSGAAPRPLPRSAIPADSFRDDGTKPMVFGMTTGTGRDEARETLALNGYRDCAETGETLFCTSANRSISDTIAVAFARNQPGKPVYLIRRVLNFKNPVSREFLERQMASRYPALLQQPGGTISSSDACGDAIGLDPSAAADDALEVLYNKRKSDSAIDDATLDLIEACPDFYALAFDGQQTVSNAEIVLFDASAMRSEHSAALRERRSTSQGEKSLDGSLKF